MISLGNVPGQMTKGCFFMSITSETVLDEDAAASSVEESSADLGATDERNDDISNGGDDMLPAVDHGDTRKRGWFVQRSYPYDRDDVNGKYYNATEQEWVDGVTKEWTELGQSDFVKWINFIVHDKDVVLKGKTLTKKPVHMHAVVSFNDAKTQSAVMTMMCGNNKRVNNAQIVDGRKGGYKSALLYLTHHTESAYQAEKTWYHHEDVHQIKEKYLDLIKKDTRKKRNGQDVQIQLEHYIEAIMSGDIKLAEAKRRFRQATTSVEFIKHRKDLEAAYDEYRNYMIDVYKRKTSNHTFEKVTTYISGPGRSGKSLLSTILAELENGEGEVFNPATGGSDKITDDFVDLHEMEKATVFHDVDSTTYSKRSFFTMFDPYSWTPSRSRGKVKPWFSTACYLAVNLPLGDFMIEMLTKGESRMTMNPSTADDLIMGFGRVARWLHYGEKDGRPVLWLYQRKPASDLPTKKGLVQDLRARQMYVFDGSVVSNFYDVLGYVPYDDSEAIVVEERRRIADVVMRVYRDHPVYPSEYVKFKTVAKKASPFTP